MTADYYLKHAEECERLAALAELDSNKRALLQSAEMWRRLANASDASFNQQTKSAKIETAPDGSEAVNRRQM